AVGPGGVAARSGRRVARACGMTLVGGHARDRIGADADAGLAGVGLRAGAAVIAAAAVGPGGVAAGAGRGIADAGGVTLVGGHARDRIGAHADARLAGVGLRAGVAVV